MSIIKYHNIDCNNITDCWLVNIRRITIYEKAIGSHSEYSMTEADNNEADDSIYTEDENNALTDLQI